VARITAALLAWATSGGLIYAALSQKALRWIDWIAVVVGMLAIAGTAWSLVFLEYKGVMIVEPTADGGPADLKAFHGALTGRYATRTKGPPDFESRRLEYIFSGGDKQFYYHLAKGITEVPNGPKVAFSIR
jgi:hypothetical protein